MSGYDMESSPDRDAKDAQQNDSKEVTFHFCREW